MSSEKTKAKEKKGKQKALPKLKAILANPNKTRCPILDEAELENLKLMLRNVIQESELEPRAFATKNGICLGLESSLRKINNQTSSCVFISLSIKPHYIVSLIARNAQVKNGAQPIFAQPKLENFIKEIFGIQALCMVFPKDLSKVSEKLYKWVEKHRKPEKKKEASLTDSNSLAKKPHKKKEKKPDGFDAAKPQLECVTEESKSKFEKVTKSWSGDFISFGKNHEKSNATLDGDEAVNALTEIIDKIPTSKKTVKKVEEEMQHMEVDSDENLSAKKNESDDTDSDNFLGEYKALTVHKIKGNPNKKPKKKRKKNKMKNSLKK